jgi:Transposase and inactivated derivatives
MKMLDRGFDLRGTVEILNIEERIPADHLLRKIDRAVDFSHIYDLICERYSKDKGRKSVDPVVLFKTVLIQHLYGIPSLRQTMREIDMNMAYRWFLGYNFSEAIPHFATVSYAFAQRYDSQITEEVFQWILYEAEKTGYIEPEVVFVDATHIKASANIKKRCKQAIPRAARVYDEQLRAEINADREKHGKKAFDDDENDGDPPSKTVTVSTTDPDAGLFHKGEHKKCFAYGAHTVCDRNNFILDVEVTPGNVHDSVVFDRVYDRVTDRFPEVQVITADAGYKTPWICKKVFDDGRLPSLPYKRPMTANYGHKWYEYVYDEYNDWIICPEYRSLSYSTTNREGYREYKSKPYICETCPTRQLCTHSRSCQKTVTRHVWQDYLEMAEDVRHSPVGRAAYDLRSQTIERVFADAKEKHGMRYTHHRSLTRVTNWVRLKFAAMNLKKLAVWRWKERLYSLVFLIFKPFNAVRAFS